MKYFSVFQAVLIRAPCALKNSDFQPLFGVSRLGVEPINPFVVSVHLVTVVKQILGHPEFMFAFVAFFCYGLAISLWFLRVLVHFCSPSVLGERGAFN